MLVILYTFTCLYAIGGILMMLADGNKIINLNTDEPFMGEDIKKLILMQKEKKALRSNSIPKDENNNEQNE